MTKLRVSLLARVAALVVAVTLGCGGETALAQVPAAQSAVKLPKGVQFVTAVEGIGEYRLGNGLKVLLFPDESKQTVTVNITYLVGSRHENYGETGMAHLLEHLLFKGTPKHPNIPQEMTQRGARPNGTTWYDRTNYFETFVDTGDNLDWALGLEADRMVNSFIARKDLDSEMTVVRNEYESGENSPFRVLFQRLAGAAFHWHNYGKSTIGTRSDIENVKIERLQAFYRKYYQPDNAVLIVSGRFDQQKALELVVKHFGPIPKPTRVLEPTYTVEPVQDGERFVTVRRVGDTQIVAAAYRVPPGAHPDFAPLEVLTFILGDSPSGRLYKALVETKKAVSVSGFGYKLYDPGLAVFSAVVRKDDPIEPARDALLATIDELAVKPPISEEVERARNNLLKEIELTLNSSESIAVSLSNWIALGDWRLFFLHRDRLKQVSPEDVKRVAAAYFKTSNRTVGMFIPTSQPDRAEIPPAPDVAAMLKDYKGAGPVAAGEAFDPTPENIEARTLRSQLPAGLKLVLLPKKTRGETVVAQINLRFGDEKSLMNRNTARSLVGPMLMRGTKNKTRQQIQDELDRLKARVNVSGGTLTVETVREKLPEVLRLVAEILREPAFPANEFEQLRASRLSAIEQQRSDPQAIANLAYSRHYNDFYPKGDPRYVPTFEEQIAELKAVTLDDVKRFYADFYGASFGEMAVVGDFDPDAIAKLAGELLGDWKSALPYAYVPMEYREIQPANQAFETPDKANAFFQAGLNLNLRDDDPDYPALMLGNYMLGGGFLNSRLATRIRQKEGLSYGVGSQLTAGSLDRAGAFTAYAIYAPQNAARLEVAFREEIERALRDGFSAEEVEAAKSGFLQSRKVSRAQDATLAGSLAFLAHLDRTYAWVADFEKKVSALTPQDVVAALRRHLNPARMSIIKAGDFAKVKGG